MPRTPDLATVDERIRALLPEGFTWGYLGNVYFGPMRDDRWWYIFRAHPGRVGTEDDRIGGFATEECHKALPLAEAIAFAHGLPRHPPREPRA